MSDGAIRFEPTHADDVVLFVSKNRATDIYYKSHEFDVSLAAEPAGALVADDFVKMSYTIYEDGPVEFGTGWFSKEEFRLIFEFARRAELPIHDSYRKAFQTLFKPSRKRRSPQTKIPRVPAKLDFRR